MSEAGLLYEPPRHLLLRRHTDAITDKDMVFLERALHHQLRDCADYYGLRPPGVSVVTPETVLPQNEAVGIDFVDDDGLEAAVAHHGYSEGAKYAWSLIGVKETWSWTQAASHEAIEMLLNWKLDQWVTAPDGARWPREACDPVEAYGYPMTVNLPFGESRDVQLSDFVVPSFWDARGRWAYDYLGMLGAPFTVAPGGYALVEHDGAMVEVGGSVVVGGSRRAKVRATSRARALRAPRP